MRKWIWAGLAILVLAAVLRFVNLNSFPVFADESIYIRWSQVMKAESTLRFLPLSDGKQPLFMWTVIPFLKFISDPLVAGRLVSGLCGLLTVIGVCLSGYLLFANRRLALFAAVIWAVIPYAVFFDRLALADSMLTMFLVWTFVFSYLTFKHLRLDTAMLAGFALGFAWLTKSPAIFAFPLLIVTLIILSPRKIKSLLLVLVTFVIAFTMYNILRLGPEFHMIAIRNADYVIPVTEVLKHPLDPFMPHLGDILRFFLYFLTPLGFGLALLGLAGQREHAKARFVLGLWWLIPVLTQAFIAKVFTARYLLYTIPFAVILIAHGIWHIGDHTKKHFLAVSALALLILISLISDYYFVFDSADSLLPPNERAGYLEEWTAGYGLREVSSYLKKIPGNIIVGSEGFFGTPFSALEMYLNNYPNIRVVGIGLNVSSIDPKLSSALADNQVFLVINASRFFGNPDKLHLKLLAEYPKVPDSSGLTDKLLFFQLLSK
jgi:4-amino-4-deoxy-L-arabinose transferase-like glycosyltransferase